MKLAKWSIELGLSATKLENGHGYNDKLFKRVGRHHVALLHWSHSILQTRLNIKQS